MTGRNRAKRLQLTALGCFAALAVAAPSAQAVETWNPATHDFGSRDVGTTTQQTLILVATCDANIGSPTFYCVAPVGGVHNIGPPKVTGDGFKLDAAGNTCASGTLVNPTGLLPAVCQLVVNFSPTSAGAKTGTLVTPSAATPDVPLQGTAVALPAAKKCKKKGKKKKCKKKK